MSDPFDALEEIAELRSQRWLRKPTQGLVRSAKAWKARGIKQRKKQSLRSRVLRSQARRKVKVTVPTYSF